MPKSRLEVLVGSVRPERFAPVVLDWFLRRAAEAAEFDIGVLDLAETGLRADLVDTPATEAFRARIGAAEAVVAITSEYNHGYPAALKTAFDSVKHEWRGKPIGFVSYGGLSGGLRATEQLRQVVAELHMVSIRETVSFHQARKRFDANGETTDPAATDAVTRLLRQLSWWTTALTAARTQTPYPG